MSENRKPQSIFDKNIEALTRLSTFDQLDVKFVLLNQFLGLSELMKSPEVDESIIETHILLLNSMIPESMKDKQFLEESKKAIVSIPVDTRTIFLGRRVGPVRCLRIPVRVGQRIEHAGTCEGCEKLEQGCLEKEEQLSPIRLNAAIVGLFDRSGLWFRKTPKTLIGAKKDESAESELD